MIRKLLIENYALIERVDLEFSEGLTIITGETGAGKSIMLDALGLLLGERADSKAIADKTKKTIIEAVFTNLPSSLSELLKQSYIDVEEDELIVRREISPSGRSRAFINDTPVTLSILSDLISKLVDIHSQNSNNYLQQPENQITIIDDFAKDTETLHHYQNLFENYRKIRKEIKTIKDSIEKQKEKKEFIAFRLEQLDKIRPKEGELEKIEKEFELLSDADQIKNDLGEACFLLDESENSVIGGLSSVNKLLESTDLSLFEDNEEVNLEERLNTIIIDLKDISETLSGYLNRVESDPGRMIKLSSRMNQLYDAIKRFKVKNESELVALHKELKDSLETMDTGDEKIEELEKESKQLAIEIKKIAEELTEKRNEAAEKFSQKLEETTIPLGLPNLKVKVDCKQGKLTVMGQDTIEILSSFNKNSSLLPISEVASGGETSRLMLGIRSIMSDNSQLPTIIFDEIDTGVSGEIADRMGSMMLAMAKGMQVITITHLPQVAAKGNAHFKVYKSDNESKTVSNVKRLDERERITEIASMLSGTKVNDAALANAKALLEGL